MMRAVILAVLMTSCAGVTLESSKPAVSPKAATNATVVPKTMATAPEHAVAPKKVVTSKAVAARQPVAASEPALASKPVEAAKAAAAPKVEAAEAPKAVVPRKSEQRQKEVPIAPAKKAVARVAAVTPKPAKVPEAAAATKAPAAAKKTHLVSHVATSAKPATNPPVGHVVAKATAAQPVVQAHVQVVASAPAGAPAGAPAAGPAASDWRKEYAHTDDPEKLKWKWTTNKPGSYDISKKAPPKFLPIGEGAYQSAEAVAQRTKDSTKDCEEGKWNDCFLKAGGDLADGHNYKHLEGKFGDTPAHRSGAMPMSLGLAVFVSLFAALTH